MKLGRNTFAVLVVVGAAAAYYGYTHGGPQLVMAAMGKPPAEAGGPPPAFVMPVPVARVVKRTLPLTLDYSARTESIRNVTLQAKVGGYVQAQPAPDGADVKAGDLLYRIDGRDYQAALDQANAAIARDQASLDYARSNFHRGEDLAKTGYLAKDSFDQRSSSMQQAEGALTLDRAAAHAAELNLGYTEIRAPFPGRLGRDQAPLGTLVGAGGTVLNTLVQLDPIYVTFNPSETDLTVLAKARAGGKVAADVGVPGSAMAPHRGELTFIDNAVDRLTGTVTARATIDNPDFSLLPGQYVSVTVHVGEEADVLMVPQTAVGSSQLGKYVYVVGDGNRAEQKLITLGAADHDLVAVLKGVSLDDRIITGNLQKIGPGAPVSPLPDAPAAGS